LLLEFPRAPEDSL
jgi:hypothetical protein